jgi:hypothetical protein
MRVVHGFFAAKVLIASPRSEKAAGGRRCDKECVRKMEKH